VHTVYVGLRDEKAADQVRRERSEWPRVLNRGLRDVSRMPMDRLAASLRP
jgi:hypothetical protein